MKWTLLSSSTLGYDIKDLSAYWEEERYFPLNNYQESGKFYKKSGNLTIELNTSQSQLLSEFF